MADTKISEAVGIVGSMPGTEGFTMACFKADEVPVGTPLYLHPQPADMSFDAEAMLAVCVPGGSIVDPQVIADNIRAWEADRKPAELAKSPAGHELAYAVEKALGNRDGKRDAELDELLEMAMHELNAIDTNLPAELAGEQGVGAIEQVNRVLAQYPVMPYEGKNPDSSAAGWRAGWNDCAAYLREHLPNLQPCQPNIRTRAEFEDWYVQNAFDYVAAPIGSRDCALSWKAWQAALAATGKQQVGEVQGDARMQFEAWCGKSRSYSRDRNGNYIDEFVADDWELWQAALTTRQPVEGIPGQPTRTYSLDVLGNPMRKDKNGVYESAEWPSDRQPGEKDE